MYKKQIITILFFLITNFLASTIPVAAQFSDDQFKSISTVLTINSLDFVNNGQPVPPALIQCTNGIYNQSPRVTSIQQANQVCRDTRNRDQLLFNCIRRETTYSCANRVNASQVNQQPSGNVQQEQNRIRETSLDFAPQQFRFQGSTFAGECSISNTMGNLAVCRRPDAGSQRYYGCVDSVDPLATVRFNCSVDKGILNTDVNSLNDINISQSELEALQNQAFDPGGIGSGNQNPSAASSSAGPVTYTSFTNFPGVGRISSLCQLITALWYLGFIVLFTSVLGMFIYGGFMYVTAGVNAGKVNQAKEIFTNTIIGLVIGLSIFIILNIINPGLLQGNCSIPSVGSGGGGNPPTLGGPGSSSNIVPKPGESVFPVTFSYQGPSGGQAYGAPRRYGPHSGIDFTPCWDIPGGAPYTKAGWESLPILAFRDGTVTQINERGLNDVRIRHADGVETRYSHNSRILVSAGQEVKAGQEIARLGDRGSAGAPHLHLDVFINGSTVNPANILLDGSKNPDPSKVKTTGSPRSGCAGL